MSEEIQTNQSFYFSTRDLLTMATLAALGGVASTYINFFSDAVHAVLGFPGATQWAAGLHVIWIVLAMGILRKPGTGTVIGLFKGTVELMSGNSHGVIILLVNLVAGMLVDFGFLIIRNKQKLLPYLIAGGLATGSNVLVFQLFATIPTNILGLTAILILFFVAFSSGLLFSGYIPFLLVKTLKKAGVIRPPEPNFVNKKLGWQLFAGAFLIAILLTVFLHINLRGGETILITGAVENPYQFPEQKSSLQTSSRQMNYRGVMTEFTGFPLIDVIDYANPSIGSDTVLIEASDGYGFIISFDELSGNPNILLVRQGQGQKSSFDVVGPESSKAWVRNVAKITITASEGLKIIDTMDNIHEFNPEAWLGDMDSTQINLPNGSQKLQGVPVWKIVEFYLDSEPPSEIRFSSEESTLSFDWSEINENNDLRLFTVIENNSISFVLGQMSGELILNNLKAMEIK